MSHEDDVVAAVLGGRWPIVRRRAAAARRGVRDLPRRGGRRAACCRADQRSRALRRARAGGRAGLVAGGGAGPDRGGAGGGAADDLGPGSPARARLDCRVAVLGMAWPSFERWRRGSRAQTLGADSRIGDVAALVTAAMQRSLPLAFVVAACLVLAPRRAVLRAVRRRRPVARRAAFKALPSAPTRRPRSHRAAPSSSSRAAR